MASKEQTITLLRINKRAMVTALRANGHNVDETMRAADFPRYARWGSGLLDLHVAAVRIADGSMDYFTVQEWQDLDNANKALYIKKGLRVRAYGEDFIISPDSFAGLTWQQAVDKAVSYKGHTLDADGVEDTADWHLPTKHQAQIFYRCREQIDTAWQTIWSSSMKLATTHHWTKELQAGSNYWSVNAASGWYAAMGQNSQYVCRPVIDLKLTTQN